MAGELESDSVALERVREYEELPQVKLFLKFTNGSDFIAKTPKLKTLKIFQEAEWESVVPLAEHWPSTGAIKFDRYATKYRPDLPNVLENFNLDVSDNEKVETH